MKDPYTCPRCGYETSEKPSIRRHLYSNKKQCPASKHNVDITNEIKIWILSNRVYKIPKETSTSVNQIINGNQTMFNFVCSMDTVTKIQSCVHYQNKELVGLTDFIENKYLVQKEEMENGKGDHQLEMDDLLNTIDGVTKTKQPEEMNIVYDSSTDKLFVYDSCAWNEMIMKTGTKTIVDNVREYYWNAYELYLIRRIRKVNESKRAKLLELLKTYYSFLACFELRPWIFERTDHEILYNAENERFWNQPRTESAFGIEEQYMQVYRKVKDETKNLVKMKNEVITLVKNNTKGCLKDLNKTMMEIIQVDEDFKKRMLNIITKINLKK